MTSILIDKDDLFCANVGDSRALALKIPRSIFRACLKPKDIELEQITVDHKPADEKERERIESRNGQVKPIFKGNQYVGVDRVWIKD